MVQTIQTELSINSILQSLKYRLMLTLLNISEACSMIQRLKSYNLMTDKGVEKSLEQFTDQIKKPENSEINFR